MPTENTDLNQQKEKRYESEDQLNNRKISSEKVYAK